MKAIFETWIKTRSATGSSDQNPELVARVEAIEQLKLQEHDAQRTIETLRQDAVTKKPHPQ